MSWKQLKIFAIVVLLLLDSLFLFLLVQRRYAATHYDNALIDSVTDVFRDSELYVDRKFLSEKIASLPVYAGTAMMESSSKILKAIENAGYEIINAPDGITCTNATSEFFFGDDFGFYYTEKGYYERPSKLLTAERYVLLTGERQCENIRKIVDAFLKKYALDSSSGTRYRYELSHENVYMSGVNYIVTLKQTVDGVPIYEDICVLVSGGRVVGADGVFAMITPTAREKAEMVDLVNILFAEKALLDEQNRQNGGLSYVPMVLSDVSYSYTVYFSADGRFYYVPLCSVTYANGETRTYNCVSGKIYS